VDTQQRVNQLEEARLQWVIYVYGVDAILRLARVCL
jgi:hypothetical protein